MSKIDNQISMTIKVRYRLYINKLTICNGVNVNELIKKIFKILDI